MNIKLSTMEQVALTQYSEICQHWYCHYCLAPLRRPDEPVDDEDVNWRWIKQDGRVFYLGRQEANIDHVVPRSRGGTDEIENLVLCCRSCNSIKGNRPLWAFEAVTKEWMWRNRHFMVWIYQEWTQWYYRGLSEREKQHDRDVALSLGDIEYGT